MHRRTILGRILAGLQLLVAVFCLAAAIYLLFLIRTPEIRADKDAAQIAYGLRIAAAILVLPAVGFGVAGFALWIRRRWGWWLGLLASMCAFAGCVYSQWDDRRRPDPDDWYGTILFAMLTAFFFLPGVRNYLVADHAGELNDHPRRTAGV